MAEIYPNNVFYVLQHSTKQSSTVELENWHGYNYIVILLEKKREEVKNES